MMKKPASEHVFVIEIKDPSKDGGYIPIGNYQFNDINWCNRSSEFGIVIGEISYWDKGYSTETLRLLVKYGFNTLYLHRIWLQVFAENKRGIHSYEKAGFQYKGMHHQAEYQHGEYHNINFMNNL